MKTQMNVNILMSYLNATISKDDKVQVEAWYQASKENAQILDQLYFTNFVVKALHIKQSVDVEKSLHNFKNRIKDNQHQELNISSRKSRLHYNKRIAAAAIFIGIVFLGGFTVSRLIDKLATPFIVMTNLGERAQVLLPDGSKVWLNACSELEYSSALFTKERKVKMTGEAYFEVAKDKNAPFIVNSNGLSTRVLGTKFNIRANLDDEFIVATLLEGSILVSAENRNEAGFTMKPNQQFKFDTKTGKTMLNDCPMADEYVGWIDGKIHFEQATLSEIAISLERYNNVHITFANEALKQERFTCDFDTKETIFQILSILKLTHKFDYTVDNRNVNIVNKTLNP